MGWNRARATLSCNGRTWGQVCTSTLELPYRHEPRPPGGVGLIGPEPQLAWWYAGDGELTRTGWGTAHRRLGLRRPRVGQC